MDKKESIRNVSMFKGLSPDQIDHLADIAIVKSYRRNQTIFAEGEDCHSFYVIINGMVRIFKLAPSGKEQIIHIFRDGDIFGEAAVFSGGKFPAFATAIKETKVILFPKDKFVRLIKDDPDLSLRIIGTLSERLKQFVSVIENLSLKEVSGRLASYLLHLSDKSNQAEIIELDITKGNLASLLGTIPETLSRILAKMSDEGIIESIGNRTIKILDIDSLESLASGESRLR